MFFAKNGKRVFDEPIIAHILENHKSGLRRESARACAQFSTRFAVWINYTARQAASAGLY